jgi:hypothetical protein
MLMMLESGREAKSGPIEFRKALPLRFGTFRSSRRYLRNQEGSMRSLLLWLIGIPIPIIIILWLLIGHA